MVTSAQDEDDAEHVARHDAEAAGDDVGTCGAGLGGKCAEQEEPSQTPPEAKNSSPPRPAERPAQDM